MQNPICRLLPAVACISIAWAGCLGPATTFAQTKTPAWRQVSDEEADRIATNLLSKMTLEEKQRQLLAYCPNGVPRLGIPNLQAGEALHGVVSDGCTSFPMSIALGSTWDPDLMKQIGTAVGAEARAIGLDQVFAPMLGLARDPRWGRVEESYGEDPYLVSRIGANYIEGLQGMGPDRFGPNHVIATAKHFVADGEPWAGANGEDFDTSERVLREIYFPPFEAAVEEARCGSIMPAHHALNGVPCHANTWLLETVLRKEWGFKGFVTSDMSDIPKVGGGHRYTPGKEDTVAATLDAGVDMELIGNYYKDPLTQAIKDGKVAMATVDQAARRVLRAKIQLIGLLPPDTSAPATAPAPAAADQTQNTILNHKGPDDIWAKLVAEGKFTVPKNLRRPDAGQVLNDPSHAALALKAAEEEIVLLKNEKNLLPLDKSKINHLLVVGPVASMINLGGYSGKPQSAITIVDGLKTYLGADKVSYQLGCDLEKPLQPNDPQLAAAVEQAKQADVIIAVVGFTKLEARENLDRDNLDLIGGQEGLVEAMQATGKPVVVVLSNGAPLSIDWIQDNIPAIVEAWYGGQAAGQAVAQVLFGDVNPGGKLNVSFPRSVGQVPCYYDHPPLTGPIKYFGAKTGVLYAFGHGLSYTTFKYGDLKADPPTIGKDQVSQVSFTVKNTGPMTGDEVAQLYIRQDFTSRERPVLKLTGFRRLTLKPGEQQTVTFPVGFEQIKFWKDGQWVAEPGLVNLKVGSASDDIRLKGTVTLQ